MDPAYGSGLPTITKARRRENRGDSFGPDLDERGISSVFATARNQVRRPWCCRRGEAVRGV
ncbi:tRNA uridine 5-carboxymethylaminomethyl modification enzyme MnmG [Gossypium arboreum]|uniref:tRNA uridine 5-carboxymethylaminomethyl modification enzyme MnmG n=1 Tax=Gossypium arboreum TaxID=29729 RepID=A0A0B0M7L1_GOSAR|nr:tRNA uridine 5-carboxymethylaminomethyl modification enzyme MnmG [Gossypium arboreum]